MDHAHSYCIIGHCGAPWDSRVHARMGTIKDRNGRNLTEAEDIKKRLQEYTEALCKKYLHDNDESLSHFLS